MFGISLNVDGVGYITAAPERKLDAAKSFAGKAFRKDAVKSVCVYDNDGIAHLYLKKTDNGVVREER
jgi:hypothetical protein